MKKNLYRIVLFSFFVLTCSTLQAQDLLGKLYGSWSITKYQWKAKTEARSGTLIFQPDGTFISEGTYFGVQKGLYRTDENQSIVIIEAGEKTSEWIASIKNNVLRLHSASRAKRSRIFITLIRIQDQEASKGGS